MEKWNRKLDYFTEKIIHEVDLKKRLATHQLANSLSANAAQKLEHAEAEITEKVADEKRRLENSLNRRLAEFETEEKREFITKRNSRNAEFIKEIENDLINFTETEEYTKYLTEQIEQKKDGFEIVKLRPQDMHLDIENIVKEEGDDDYIGGFILLTKNRIAKSDLTFKTRLSALESAYE